MNWYGNHTYLKVKKVKDTSKAKPLISKMVFDYYDNAPGLEDALRLARESRHKVLADIGRKRPDNCGVSCGKHEELDKQVNYSFLDKSFKATENPFASLHEQPGVKKFCKEKIKVYYNSFAMVHNVNVRPFNWNGSLIEGGRELYKFKDETLRTEEKEVVRPVVGLFDIYCANNAHPIDAASKANIDMLKYFRLRSLKSILDVNSSEPMKQKHFDHMTGYTIAIVRDIYANMYHMTLHIHNIFLMLLHSHIQPRNLTILILDAHPKTEADNIVETLYGSLVRVTNLRRPVKVENLILCLRENRSPLSMYSYPSLPYIEEFRSFVLNQYHLEDKTHALNCSKLHITIIWRRDKVYHPRNLKGSTERKIFNEAEVFNTIYETYPHACVSGVLLDALPMVEQLKIVRKTDVLIGMHGAGMTHAIFLPQTSGIIELFPQDWRGKHHYFKLFEAIAKWRKLRYMFWENKLSLFEMPHFFTVVDINALKKLVHNMVESICTKI